MSGTMKISQSAFIQDFVIEKRLIEYNTNMILMKTDSTIEMTKLKNYKKANLYIYQWLIGKLMYLVCGMKPNISFVIRQLSRYNANPR